MRIGVVGVGVVGGAVYKAFKEKQSDTLGYDINGKFDSFEKTVDKANILFVCLPTPTNSPDEPQNINAIRDSLEKISDRKYQGIVCLKSTVLPGTTEYLQNTYSLKMTHNPEFLRASDPYGDLINQTSILVSGADKNTSVVVQAYRDVGFNCPVLAYENFKVTELAKYMHNMFLTVKVSFSNEMYELAQAIGVSYDDVREAALSAGGIGDKHTKVPGPDGSIGFGGMCFPKDSNAILNFAKLKNIKLPTIDGAVEGNKVRRPEYYHKD